MSARTVICCLLALSPLQLPVNKIHAETSGSRKNDQTEFFEREIRPLLAKHCFECHDAANGPDNGNLVLSSAPGIKAGGSRGSSVIPTDPAASLLIKAVKFDDDDLQMPPTGMLPKRDIAKLEEWIRRGATLPDYGSTPVRSQTSKIDWNAARQHWAFRPLEVPVVPHSPKARNPIDCFIYEKLAGVQLNATQRADPATLIRRLSFNLTGLPPTPAEVENFVRSSQLDREVAIERAVDRLLATPHYGERWGRFWLDLARYTDTTATWLKGTGEAWVYRDWVVRVFNEDMPFNRFVKLQLAADHFKDIAPVDIAALGFLGLSPTYWKELRLAPSVIKRVVAEEWDERIDAVSRTFLGLTVACARCHDHKFDPISTTDYYALAGVFASTQLVDRPLLPEKQALVVAAAHQKVSGLEEKFKEIKDKKSEAAVDIRKQINAIRVGTPQFDALQAHVVEDSSIFVLPDGPDKTRLEYKPGEPRNVALFRRGNPSNAGPDVARRFLQLFTDIESEKFKSGSGRRELAESLFTNSRSLVARVIVNRIWEQHFGFGLVRTPSNFGIQGEKPTHPELLDYLAGELIRNHWSLKSLHRMILRSNAWQRRSVFTNSSDQARAKRVDPENRLLARMTRKRLDVEMWRDAMLLTAGNLNLRFGGAAQLLDDKNNHRRTIYGLIARRDMNRMLRLYDFPEPTSHSPKRVSTTTPLQQLYVLNAPFIEQQSRHLAGRLINLPDDTQRIELCYQLLFSRKPAADELSLGLEFIAGNAAKPNQLRQLWQLYIHSLLGLNEFFFID